MTHGHYETLFQSRMGKITFSLRDSFDCGNPSLNNFLKQSATGLIKSTVSPIPALLIGRLAFEMALAINEMSGTQAIVVDTIDAEAEDFMTNMDFKKLKTPIKMIISLKHLHLKIFLWISFRF
jgi:hypothetical protein